MITNHTIWITGASSGLGEALALELSKGGNRLVLSARRVEELRRVQSQCENRPEDVMVLPMDMLDRSSMDAHLQKIIERLGLPDIVILNAGISNRSFIKDTQYDVFERIMNVNFFGNVAMTKAILPHFLRRRSGKFVVVSSVSGRVASPGRGAYAASKHALHGFFDTLRMEHHRDGVQVLIACPGFVQTNVTKNSLRGDGTPQGVLDKTTANGMPATKAAQRIIDGIEKNKKELLFGGIERFTVYIKRFIPSLLLPIVLKNENKWKLDNTVD